MPSRVRIAEQLLIPFEQEQAVEQSNEEGNQRQIWYEVVAYGRGRAARQRLRPAGKISQG